MQQKYSWSAFNTFPIGKNLSDPNTSFNISQAWEFNWHYVSLFPQSLSWAEQVRLHEAAIHFNNEFEFSIKMHNKITNLKV